MSDARIPLSEPYLVGNASAYLDECLRTNFVSSVGPFVDRFEREFAAFVGARFAVACATGTAALHVAMRLTDVGAGDEVWVASLTFIASANPILYQGGKPVLVDSEAETWNANPALMVEELERRAGRGLPMPKLIEVVHILGEPARIDELAAACERYGVTLIEDAAESLGARYVGGRFGGRHVGTIGRFGCYSFNGNKVITCGGGGMIVTDDEQLARRAKHLTTQARLPGLAYRHDEVGYNYRLSNLSAALGVAQLEQLPDFLARKRMNAAAYDVAFAGIPGLTVKAAMPWAESSCWLYSIVVDGDKFGCTRDELLSKLIARGIESRPIWSPLHTMPIYADAPRLGSGAVAERLAAQAVSLPSSVSLTADQQARVIDVVRGASRSA
jgi:dTDP-4-amino-4,6-dideoxygalactose transaminase